MLPPCGHLSDYVCVMRHKSVTVIIGAAKMEQKSTEIKHCFSFQFSLFLTLIKSFIKTFALGLPQNISLERFPKV